MLPSEIFKELNDYIKTLPNNKLIILCNEIYGWKYEIGEFPENSAFNSLSKKFNYSNGRAIQNSIIEEALRRYRRLSLLLIKESPTHFLQQ